MIYVIVDYLFKVFTLWLNFYPFDYFDWIWYNKLK